MFLERQASLGLLRLQKISLMNPQRIVAAIGFEPVTKVNRDMATVLATKHSQKSALV
jgi:hypothetical protein